MWLFNLLPLRSNAVMNHECGREVDLQKSSGRSQSSRSRIFFGLVCCFLALSIFLATAFPYGLFKQGKFNFAISGNLQSLSSRCINPSVRREWRSLDQGERNDYISAVKCLKKKPSQVRSEGTLYDDFPFVHKLIGGYSHGAAPFLAWHRYFLHVYEKTLRDQCGYTGTLTYWDWSLDWEDLANSPVFDAQTGFGGDGNLTGELDVGGGRCVVDGPFKDLVLPFFNGEHHNHCLSRGFRDGDTLGQIPGEKLQPIAIEEILRIPDYESFFLALEDGPHNTIARGIGGDFTTFTAPNDPLFYLHHSQLDRLWSQWQQADARKRLSEYAGIDRRGSTNRASLDDMLPMDGLAESVRVSDIMNSESGLLCYKYH